MTTKKAREVKEPIKPLCGGVSREQVYVAGAKQDLERWWRLNSDDNDEHDNNTGNK